MLWVVGGLWVFAGSIFAAAQKGAKADQVRLQAVVAPREDRVSAGEWMFGQ